MSNPATPLNNKEAITQLNQAMNLLVTELVRPTMLQTQANAQAIARLTAQIDRTENIARLADEVSSENEQRFETLLAESRAERLENARKFDEMGQRIDRALDELAAQRESTRALLSTLAMNQSAVANLSDRVDQLEAS